MGQRTLGLPRLQVQSGPSPHVIHSRCDTIPETGCIACSLAGVSTRTGRPSPDIRQWSHQQKPCCHLERLPIVFANWANTAFEKCNNVYFVTGLPSQEESGHWTEEEDGSSEEDWEGEDALL